MAFDLYHCDVYAPPRIFRSPGLVAARYSKHARKAAEEDQYGDLSRFLTPYIQLDFSKIVEVEVDLEGSIVKRVVRLPVTSVLDLVLVVQGDGFVRTAWGNLESDSHGSLDVSKFVADPALTTDQRIAPRSVGANNRNAFNPSMADAMQRVLTSPSAQLAA